MAVEIPVITLPPSDELPRYLTIHVFNGGSVIRVQVYAPDFPKRLGRMLAFGMGPPRFSRGVDGLSLWANETGFDVTDAEAATVAQALGLELPKERT